MEKDSKDALIFGLIVGQLMLFTLCTVLLLCVLFPGMKVFETKPEVKPDVVAAELEAAQQAEFEASVLNQYGQAPAGETEAVRFTEDTDKQPLLAPNPELILETEQAPPVPAPSYGERL
jgi:hypothetical protein